MKSRLCDGRHYLLVFDGDGESVGDCVELVESAVCAACGGYSKMAIVVEWRCVCCLESCASLRVF